LGCDTKTEIGKEGIDGSKNSVIVYGVNFFGCPRFNANGDAE
jgi:hypothetical protein